MKVTAFHLAEKVEESAQSYFSNSFVFSSRKVSTERIVDFRNGVASLQFFLHEGDEDGSMLPMGGIEFVTIQERDNKVAFQCRLNVLPSGYAKQFFLMMGSDSEQYVHYSNLSELLRKQWEKNLDAYLPKGEDGMPMAIEEPAALDPDDEYEGLTPEEIEAVTGVRPEPKGSLAAAPAASAAADDDMSMEGEIASEDEIQRLMGMMSGEGHDDSSSAADDSDGAPADMGGGNMTMEEIEALAREVGGAGADSEEESAAAAEDEASADDAKKESSSAASNDEPVEMSAEDIWKQISGG